MTESLLREIQNEASSSTSRLSDVLRKCLILATRLDSRELKDWVSKELNGYSNEEKLPEYRIYSGARSMGHFVGPFGSAIKNEVPTSVLPEKFREFCNNRRLVDGVSVYEELLSTGSDGEFMTPWPPILISLAKEYYVDYKLFSAHVNIPRSVFVRILDTVRNSILGFVLEIEIQNPNAGEALPNEVPIDKDVTRQVFHTHIHGNVGTMNLAGDNADIDSSVHQQNQILNVDIADLSKQLQELQKSLIQAATEPSHFIDIAKVKGAEIELSKDNVPKAIQYLKEASSWVAEKAGEIGVSIVTELIKKHSGLN